MSLQQEQPIEEDSTPIDNNGVEKANGVTPETENDNTDPTTPDISTPPPTITITDTDYTPPKMNIPTIVINHGTDGEDNDDMDNNGQVMSASSPDSSYSSSSVPTNSTDDSVELVTSPEETEHPYDPTQLHEQEPLQQEQLHLRDQPEQTPSPPAIVIQEPEGKYHEYEQQEEEEKEVPKAVVADRDDNSPSVQQQPSPESAHLQLSPVIDFYRGKTILLTGATGFVGKSVLWKLVQSLGPSLGKIYLLIRNGSNKRSKIGRPADRIKSEIINNKAFLALRTSMGEATFDYIMQEKVIPIAGDIISPDLSLSDQDRETIIQEVHVVIHCAATLDYHERLDLALETNTLGTLRLMDLADECYNMLSFVHMSVSYFNANLPDGYVQERVYPMEIGDPEELLKEIVGLELHDIPKMTQRIMASYPNTYTFTKFLTEHLILKRVDYNRVEEAQGGKKQWPISIVRATQVGAGAYEPLPGWVDGVTGTNGAVFLLGHGIQVLQSDIGHMPADIIPVDYLARVVISSAAVARSPGTRFLLPYNEIITEEDEIASPLPQPIVPCFPIIYQVSGSSLKMATWREIYESVRHYWVRNTKITLPTGQEYFVNNRALLKARFFMKNHLSNSLSSVNTANAQINNTASPYGTRNISNKPTNRTIELASRIVEANQPFLRHRWVFDHQNVRMMGHDLESDAIFRLSPYKHIDWPSYMVNYSYGTHLYIAQCPLGLRNIVVPSHCDCALYSKHQTIRDSIVEKQIESVVFSISDIQKRTERMLTQLIETLENPSSYDPRDKKKSEEWVNDFDASLDDWCHDDTHVLKDSNATAMLGRWARVLGENDEAIKVVVLNDKRVRDSVEQIINSSGVPQTTVVGEAFKVLQRMRERTQLPYVWFAGAFLDCLFKRLFTSIRIQEEDLIKLKEQISGKNVVYVPVSKTILDQLLVWYICLRYHLPMPAIICDEALALLGPISDIFRIAGAYFVRRDQTTRSPLNTAVTAAYTEALLHEHGALSMLIEKTRSRTGRLHNAYSDGLIDMVLDASLEKHQPSAPSTPTHSRNSLPQKIRKDTVFVPLNITYEKIPELHMLIDQVLDQKHQPQPQQQQNPSSDQQQQQKPQNQQQPQKPSASVQRMGTLSRSTSFLRPSASMAGRTANKDNGVNDKCKYGRVYIGIGDVIDVRKMANERDEEEQDNREFANSVARMIQKRHHEATAVSPVSLVAAVVLFGRTSNGITMGDMYNHVTWFRDELKSKGIPIDWQDDEDVDAMVAYALNLLDGRKNVTIEGKRVTDYSNVRVVEHADNVMALSYMANQLVEILLPDALFAISYFSTGSDQVSRQELFASFKFLIQLFRDEFIYPWNQEEKFSHLLNRFQQKGILIETGGDKFVKKATLEDDPTAYTHICLLASLLYPTLDAYWITSCSLSALRDLPYMPRKIVPVLAQWIAAHLISGRRTIYREVLSTEASQNAVDNFLAIGFIEAVHPKTKLSPDAQILLLELGVTTNEDLVMVASRRNNQENTESDDILGQIEDIASLCHNIEKHRFGTTAQLEAYRNSNAQVFDKCQNQIRTILRSGGKSYAALHGMSLSKDEDQMIQLVYSLKTAASGVERAGSSRSPRRVSQAYNLLNNGSKN